MTDVRHQVATVIRCSDLGRHVYPTLTSVERQSLKGGEIVLVADSTTPPAARQWLAALGRERGLPLLEVNSAAPGAVKNAGILSTSASYVVCVDAGDLLAPDHHEVCAGVLAENPTVGIASSAVRVIGAPCGSDNSPAARFGIEGLIEGPHVAHSASMFRRETWTALRGFHEALPALDYYEFWLRVAAAGNECVRTNGALLVRTWRKDSLWYRDETVTPYLEAMASICRIHLDLLRNHLVRVLYSRERQLAKIGETYRRLIQARDNGVEERNHLVQRASELRGELPQDRRSGVDLGDLRRASPIDREWGYTRGVPVDRHYIEQFVESNAADITGRVLEVQESDYTKRFGCDRVTHSDVLDLNPDNSRANIVSDLRAAANIPSNQYDCVILTQTLHVINDMAAVLGECHRILKPGGVLLATLPCASRLCLEYGPNDDFWRVTAAGARAITEPIFGADGVEVRWFGNVLANAAFLYGLAVHELTAAELDAKDPYFPLLIGVRARKSVDQLPSRSLTLTARTPNNSGNHGS
jgi:SAM-dependent methyltransferase